MIEVWGCGGGGARNQRRRNGNATLTIYGGRRGPKFDEYNFVRRPRPPNEYIFIYNRLAIDRGGVTIPYAYRPVFEYKLDILMDGRPKREKNPSS